MRKRNTIGILSLLTLAGVSVYTLRRQIISRWLKLRPARYAVSVRRGVGVPMPDGVSLAADVYLPKTNRLLPTVLIRSPYGRSAGVGPTGWMAAFAARRLAERGYAVVVQDVRGRFDSPGTFDPFRHEGADGRATLVWLEKQPWFNAQVGMWGPSYLGYTQWAAAVDAPLYLRAIVPVVSGSRLPVLGIRDAALNADLQLRWIHTLESMARRRKRLGGLWAWLLGARAEDRVLKRAAQTLPLRHADAVVAGRSVAFFQEWLAHPNPQEDYWRQVDVGARLGRVNAAAHLVGGWYDILLRETVDDYTGLRALGRQPYLTIGPWIHTDPAGIMESLRQSLVWFDAHLKGDRRLLRSSPVRVFVMGADEWRDLPDWPPAHRATPCYLSSDGALQSEPGTGSPDAFTFDPHQPTPALGGNLLSEHAGRVDNRPLEKRADVLTYTGPVLEQPLEMIGTAQVELFVRSDRDYTDFFVRLCDVHPGGASYNVCDGFLRVRPGVGEAQPDGSLKLRISLWPGAQRFLAGHRLRLLVASGAHPRWARNPGTGEPEAFTEVLTPAHQQVYHDAEHPSVVILPVIV
jgi:putative CocE/NonD family hydrolase